LPPPAPRLLAAPPRPAPPAPPRRRFMITWICQSHWGCRVTGDSGDSGDSGGAGGAGGRRCGQDRRFPARRGAARDLRSHPGMAEGWAGTGSPVITTVFQRYVRKNGGDQETRPIRPRPPAAAARPRRSRAMRQPPV